MNIIPNTSLEIKTSKLRKINKIWHIEYITIPPVEENECNRTLPIYELKDDSELLSDLKLVM